MRDDIGTGSVKILYIIAAVLVGQIGVRAFAPAKQPLPPPQNSGQAYGSNESIAVEGRDKQRQDAFRALALPTGSLCTDAGRREFNGGLGHYYYHRQNQTERYPESFGQLGADYIAKQWSGTDDKRIDRLTQEMYASGYLKPGEFDTVARKMIAVVVKNERVTAKGCAG